MQKFYTSVILLINQSNEIGEKQFLVFGSRGGQISPLMHVPLSILHDHVPAFLHGQSKIFFFFQKKDI